MKELRASAKEGTYSIKGKEKCRPRTDEGIPEKCTKNAGCDERDRSEMARKNILLKSLRESKQKGTVGSYS